MTAQFSEKIIFQGNEYFLLSTPLESYLMAMDKPPVFDSGISACWRGYVATWEVESDKLYLSKLDVLDKSFTQNAMEYLFGETRNILADWFSGELRIAMGEMAQYVHMGFESTYAKEMFLTIKKGYVIDVRFVEHEIVEE
jgi:hypothetical protein